MPLHLLTNFEIQRSYQNRSKINGVYSKNNLPKIKDVMYVLNFGEYKSVGTISVPIYVKMHIATYFNGFGVEYISEEIKNLISNKTIKANIHRIHHMIQ